MANVVIESITGESFSLVPSNPYYNEIRGLVNSGYELRLDASYQGSETIILFRVFKNGKHQGDFVHKLKSANDFLTEKALKKFYKSFQKVAKKPQPLILARAQNFSSSGKVLKLKSSKTYGYDLIKEYLEQGFTVEELNVEELNTGDHTAIVTASVDGLGCAIFSNSKLVDLELLPEIYGAGIESITYLRYVRHLGEVAQVVYDNGNEEYFTDDQQIIPGRGYSSAEILEFVNYADQLYLDTLRTIANNF